MRDTKKILSAEQGRCFVVMGFGTKTDYATGRKLDLNKSYRLLIKPVVEEKGLTLYTGRRDPPFRFYRCTDV